TRNRPNRSRTARRPRDRTVRTRSLRALLSSGRSVVTGPRAVGWCRGSGRVGGAGLGGLALCRHVGLGDLDERGERGLVVDGQLGQHAAVDLDAGDLQALDEPVVGHPVGPGGGVDPLDPGATEVALAGPAVPVAVDQRVGDLLLGLAVQAGPLAPVAAGALEGYPALLVGVDRPLHAC